MISYEFEKWLDEHGWSYQYSRGKSYIGYYKYDGYNIDYIGLFEGKFTFSCKSKTYNILDDINIKFDVPFNETYCNYIQKELFRQLDEFVEKRKIEKKESIEKINKLFNLFDK